MTTKKNLPPVPRINLSELKDCREKLFQALYGYENTEISWQTHIDLVQEWSNILKASTVSIWGSFQPFVGEVLTDKLAKNLIWRLAGNRPLLRKGHSPMPWSASPIRRHWVLLQAVASYPKEVFDRPGSEIKWLAWTGLPAGDHIRRFWSKEYFHFVKDRLGIKTAPYVEYVVGSFIYAFIDPAVCRHGKPGFSDIRITGTLKRYNEQLLKARRRDLSPCPRGKNIPCHRCVIGYEDCPISLHPKTLEKKTCELCRQESWIDSDRSSTVCVCCLFKHMKEAG